MSGASLAQDSWNGCLLLYHVNPTIIPLPLLCFSFFSICILKELHNQVFGILQILLVRLFLLVLRSSCSTLLFLSCFWASPVVNACEEEGRFCFVLNKKDKSDTVQASALKIWPFVLSHLFPNTWLYLSLNNGLTTLLVIWMPKQDTSSKRENRDKKLYCFQEQRQS